MRYSEIIKRIVVVSVIALCAFMFATTASGCSSCGHESAPEMPMQEDEIDNSDSSEETVPVNPNDDGFGTEVGM